MSKLYLIYVITKRKKKGSIIQYEHIIKKHCKMDPTKYKYLNLVILFGVGLGPTWEYRKVGAIQYNKTTSLHIYQLKNRHMTKPSPPFLKNKIKINWAPPNRPKINKNISKPSRRVRGGKDARANRVGPPILPVYPCGLVFFVLHSWLSSIAIAEDHYPFSSSTLYLSLTFSKSQPFFWKKNETESQKLFPTFILNSLLNYFSLVRTKTVSFSL